MRGIGTIPLFVVIGFILIVVISPKVFPQSNRSVINVNRNNVAIEGYDPVAYHTLSQPVEGNPTITYQWMGANWQFSSTYHRDLFMNDPDRYAPQFGGYCSWAVSRGSTASIDPDAWHIENGKLYLNLNPRIHRNFVANLGENIRRAEANWPTIRARLSNN